MNTLEALVMRISELEKKLENLSRIAQVSKVHEDTGLVDVTFEGHEIKERPFMTMRAGEDKTYWLPSVGELGALHSPSGELGNSFFVPGIFYKNFPVPETDENKIKRIFRDGMEEEIDVGAHSYKLTSGDSERFIDRSEIKDKQGTSEIKIAGTETQIKRETGKVKTVVGSNMIELTLILMNLLGAHFFPTGMTTLQSPVGPVFFAPASSPASAPPAPAGSAANSDGEVTKTPPSTISGIDVKTPSSLTFTLPAVPVSTGGATVPTVITVSLTDGTLKLEFPARNL